MWYNIYGQEVSITILAKPNARKTALVAVTDEALHISLHAKPKQGEANKELIAYLAKLFHLPKSRIILQRGKGCRYKQVIVPLTDTVKRLLDNYRIEQ